VAAAAAQISAARQEAAAADARCQQLEGVLRATGERAAASEEDAHRASRVIVDLQQQLAELKDRCGPGSADRPQHTLALRILAPRLPCLVLAHRHALHTAVVQVSC
jgi:hypothetical protein